MRLPKFLLVRHT